jgi:hypothetical protein
MFKQVSKGIAVLAFTVVIPTVIAMMYHSIGLGIGWLIVICSAVMGAAGLIAANWRRRPIPNYDVWDKRKKFRLWEVACLMADQEPSRPLGFLARRNFRALEKAIRAYKLVVRQDDLREVIADAYDRVERGRTPKANPEWTVSREALIIYLQTVGMKPPFLFPKERK